MNVPSAAEKTISKAPIYKPKGVVKTIVDPKGTFEKDAPEINPKLGLIPIENPGLVFFFICK